MPGSWATGTMFKDVSPGKLIVSRTPHTKMASMKVPRIRVPIIPLLARARDHLT